MSVDNLLNQTFVTGQFTGGTASGDTNSDTIIYTENDPNPGSGLAQSVTVTSVSTATGITRVSGYASVSGNRIDFSGTVVGNDIGDVLVELDDNDLIADQFIYLTNTARQQPGDGGTARVQPESAQVTYEPACYASGTLIRTMGGDIRVEALQVGDLVVTAGGKIRPIRWIGHRHVDCRLHARPQQAHPVRIAAHAFGNRQPARDLYVSPGHAICVDLLGEILIPAVALLNGSTIRQVEVDEITYWHVELDDHDILLAENLPAESYLEMDNRGFFQNTEVVHLVADPDGKPSRSAAFCRPLHLDGSLVEAVRSKLDGQAKTSEHVVHRVRAA